MTISECICSLIFVIGIVLASFVVGMASNGHVTLHENNYQIALQAGQRLQLNRGMCGTITEEGQSK
jgi:hypothetical protein